MGQTLPTVPKRSGRRPPNGRGRQRRRAETTPAVPAAAGLSPPLGDRVRMGDEFFRTAGINPREFLRAFEHIPGLYFFVKDAESRTMLNTQEYAPRIGFPGGAATVGLHPHEYAYKQLADHYLSDDQQVMRTGQPLRNIIEVGFNEQGVPEWISTDKFPLRDATGRVVGIIGTVQSLKGRLDGLPHLGEVGRAADYIQRHLGERMSLDDVAAHVGLSKRHLQRLFHKSVRMTIQQFIIHSRVHAAAQEIRQSKRPIIEIALMFGFCDQSAFSTTFRRITGTPPREYRNRFLRGRAGGL